MERREEGSCNPKPNNREREVFYKRYAPPAKPKPNNSNTEFEEDVPTAASTIWLLCPYTQYARTQAAQWRWHPGVSSPVRCGPEGRGCATLTTCEEGTHATAQVMRTQRAVERRCHRGASA